MTIDSITIYGFYRILEGEYAGEIVLWTGKLWLPKAGAPLIVHTVRETEWVHMSVVGSTKVEPVVPTFEPRRPGLPHGGVKWVKPDIRLHLDQGTALMTGVVKWETEDKA